MDPFVQEILATDPSYQLHNRTFVLNRLYSITVSTCMYQVLGGSNLIKWSVHCDRDFTTDEELPIHPFYNVRGSINSFNNVNGVIVDTKLSRCLFDSIITSDTDILGYLGQSAYVSVIIHTLVSLGMPINI